MSGWTSATFGSFEISPGDCTDELDNPDTRDSICVKFTKPMPIKYKNGASFNLAINRDYISLSNEPRFIGPSSPFLIQGSKDGGDGYYPDGYVNFDEDYLEEYISEESLDNIRCFI